MTIHHIHTIKFDNNENSILEKILQKLNFIISKTNIMGEQLDAIKAKLALQDTAIDGLAADLAFIKEKLAGAENGLSATEVAELNTLIDERTAKLQALDAETDSTVQP